MTEPERRARVRERYGARCGYCGVHENEAGSELEIDHFQPRSDEAVLTRGGLPGPEYTDIHNLDCYGGEKP
jgi:hypothetical protein